MSAKAGNSIRSSRSPVASTERREVGKVWQPDPHTATVDTSSTPRSQNRSQVPPSHEPAPRSPPSVLRRSTNRGRNIPFHSGSIRAVLPPAVLTRPQRGASQAQPSAQPPQQQVVPSQRANSQNVPPQHPLQQQQGQQRPSARGSSSHTTTNSSYLTSQRGQVSSSALPPHLLPRERGTYSAPHSAARPSPPPRHVNGDGSYDSHNENSSRHHSNDMVAPRGNKTQPESGHASPHRQASPQSANGCIQPPRIPPHAGTVCVESLGAIPKAPTYAPPLQQQHQQQQRQRHDEPSRTHSTSPPITSTALALRPSPPSRQHNRRSAEGSRNRGTSTEDLDAYMHAVPPQQPRQQQYKPASYPDEVPAQPYPVARYRPTPQQQRPARPMDYYSLAPSLLLAQHRHVRRIVVGEFDREPPQPYYRPVLLQDQPYEREEKNVVEAKEQQQQIPRQTQPPQHGPPHLLSPPQYKQQRQVPQQQRQQQRLPPSRVSNAVQHQQQPSMENSTSVISETSSIRSSRTRQVFRRAQQSQQHQQRQFFMDVLPAGSPYGAKPTYNVVIPRTHRVPVGLYTPSTSTPPLQQQRQKQPQQWEEVVTDVETTVNEEPYLVMDEHGGRVVEYEPELPPPPPRRQTRPLARVPSSPPYSQQQQYVERRGPPVRATAAPVVPVTEWRLPSHVPMMWQVVHYYSRQQQQQQTQQDVYNELLPSEETYQDNSDNFDNDAAAAATLPPGAQPPRNHPPPPPPQSSVKKPSSNCRKNQRTGSPLSLPASQPQQQRHLPTRNDWSPNRSSSGGSQKAPPPTLPPPPPLRSEDNFHPTYLDGDAVVQQRCSSDNTDHPEGRPYQLYPTQHELNPAVVVDVRPSAPEQQSEQPSNATLVFPMQPRCKPDERGKFLEPELVQSRLQLEEEQQHQQNQHSEKGELEEKEVIVAMEKQEVVVDDAGRQAAAQAHPTVNELKPNRSLDLDSTIDPDDLLAQQKAQELAAELVRSSLLPPTPHIEPQSMDAPALYSDDSEEGKEEEVRERMTTHAAAHEESPNVDTGGTPVVIMPTQQPIDEIVVVSLESTAPPLQTAAEEAAHEIEHSQPHVHVHMETVAENAPAREGSLEEPSTSAHANHTESNHNIDAVLLPQLCAVEEMKAAPVFLQEPPAAIATHSEDNASSEPHRVSVECITKEEDVHVNPHSDDETHLPTAEKRSSRKPQEQLQQQEQQELYPRKERIKEAKRSVTVLASIQRSVIEVKEEEGTPSPVALLATMSPKSSPQVSQKTVEVEHVEKVDYVYEDGAEEVVEEDVGMSPLEIGERYGYVDPLEEAAMDAAYMLDTLEDQYVRINEETGEEMEDLVHVVELNRYDRTTEPRYFLPKGQYSDVLPLLRYPIPSAEEGVVSTASTSSMSAVGALTYTPLTEVAYLNLCAVIWLSRFRSDDMARLLSLAHGPKPPADVHDDNANEWADNVLRSNCASPTYFFDHPSANLLEQLDGMIAYHVRTVIDAACTQSGESFPTACARLADRNNLSYLPPSVWQQSMAATQLSVASIVDHVTEVLLTATVPQEAARRQATRQRTTSKAELQAQKTWSLFLGALPWNYDEVLETEAFAAMPTAAAQLAYAFVYKARIRNVEGGLGALTFSALSAQIPDAAVMDSLLMQEKLRLALLYSYKNVAACCTMRQKAAKVARANGHLTGAGHAPHATTEGDKHNSNNETSNQSNSDISTGWNSNVFSAYAQLWEGDSNVNAPPMVEGEDDVVDLYSIAVQLTCFFPTKTERGMHQLCAALIEDLISMDVLMVPDEVRTPEGVVLTGRTTIVDALVVEGAQAMWHIIMTLTQLGYTSTISIDDYVDASGHLDVDGVQAAMEGYLVFFDPAVMVFLSSPVPVDDLFRYIRCDGPPSMQPHTLGRKSTFVEVVRLQHIAETIQYTMEMQDAILVASQYNHLVTVHRKRVQQQQKTRPTPRSVAEELQMDAVVLGHSMDLILNAAPLLSRGQEETTNTSLLDELANDNDAQCTQEQEEEEGVLLGQDVDKADSNGEEVLLRAVLVAFCCADPTKPISEVQDYLRHLMVFYAEVRDVHSNPVDSSDPLQVAHARVMAAEQTMEDWFGQTAADGTLLPGAVPARCDEIRVNAEELAALCPRVLGRRVGMASTAIADAAAVISASTLGLAKNGETGEGTNNSEDSVLMENTNSRPPLAR